MKELLEEITKSWVAATKEKFSKHPITHLFKNKFKNEIEQIVKGFGPTYEVNTSTGNGNWANVPWLSILDPQITNTTQAGIYPVYLFCADGSGIYLSLGFGTTKLIKEYKPGGAKEKSSLISKRVRNYIPELIHWNDVIELKSKTPLGQSYEWATAGAKFYPADNIPEDEDLIKDLRGILSIYVRLKNFDLEKNIMTKTIVKTKIINVSLNKPFLLLAGISGTGKTRFVREQARSTGSLSKTYCLTSVRPDWHEPSDLLGYVSRLKDEDKYVSTDVIEFIARSWRAIIDGDLTVAEEPDEQGHNRLVVSGDKETLSHIKPYWLCLDEMNLAPVEQYFADYLSIIETRKWEWQDDNFTYGCDAILSASTINHSDYSDKLRKQLKFEGTKYESCWQLFKKHGISIPFNLIVAGTVNMDETTHGFSRKVIDRALTFDFGEFFPNDIDEFFESKKAPKSLGYPIYSQAKLDQFESVQADIDAKKTTAFFKAINEVLKGTAFELAFRAFNELCLSVISFAPKTDRELQSVFDDFLMCKVLPRIEGDEDKLASRNEGNLLEQLVPVLESELTDIWQNKRPDLFRAYKDSADETVVETDCRSYKKIEAMTDQLASGFTSFWP